MHKRLIQIIKKYGIENIRGGTLIYVYDPWLYEDIAPTLKTDVARTMHFIVEKKDESS